jgi:hypothetical protein
VFRSHPSTSNKVTKSERKSANEARKAQLAAEERNSFAKRCEQLVKQVGQLKAQLVSFIFTSSFTCVFLVLKGCQPVVWNKLG